MANRDSENSVLTREQVLALDIATHTGYFSLHEAGTWNFTESKRRNGNKMHGAFRTTLLSLLRRYGIRGVGAGACEEEVETTTPRRGRGCEREPPFLRHAAALGTQGYPARSVR